VPLAVELPATEEIRMRRITVRFLALATIGVLVTALAGPALAAANSRVTNDAVAGSYVRYDGGTDAQLTACGTGRRPQNEPTIAVDPNNTNVIAAGSNEYCRQTTGGDVWAGYYRSTDGGATWTDSLVPGYPGDESPAGSAAPTSGKCNAAGDPTQSFDNDGNLYYGYICFNRAKPQNGGFYVTTYQNDGAAYARTVAVAEGTPSTAGLFNDKVNVAVDQSAGPRSGTLYAAWVRYSGGSANNVLFVSRSTDQADRKSVV